MAGGVSSPVIISVTIGAVLVLSVALVAVVRWARTKPSTQLPPPRPASLSPYWANQQRQSSYMGRSVPDVYDEERKLTAHGSGVFKALGEYAGSNASDSSLYRGTKTPYTDGDRTPNSGVSFGHENNVGTVQQSDNQSPQLQPNEFGEVSLNSPNPPRQRPASVQFVNGTSPIRPVSSFGSLAQNGSPFATAGGQVAATDPQSSSHLPQNALPPSSFSHHQPSPPRPFSTTSRSRHSIAGLPVQQPPLSFNQPKHDRRASRMSVYSTYSSSAHTFSYDHRRSSVNSMIRGPPHKSNMQIVLPQPLAPTAAGNGLPGSTGGNYNDAEDSALRRNQRRHSRVDMWTETNNIARSKSPLVPLADLAADGSRERNRRPSQGSEKSGRSLELPNGGHFQHMQPPPPLPAASSRSFLTSSRSGTPTSSSSALPPMSSAMTTPQRSMGSSELVLEKPPSPSDAQSTSTSNNAAPADADSKPPPQQPQNDVKPDNLPIIPSSQPIETK